MSRSLTRYVPAAFLAALWLDTLFILSGEWSLNEQYEYGFLVPFITLYLLHLRWQDRPAPASLPRRQHRVGSVLLGLMLALTLPLRILYEANPDWRLLYWTFSLLATGATLLLIALWGGRRWATHFAPALCMMLFAIPWPTSVEKPLVGHLMSTVATCTVEVVNFGGIPAVREGNLIHMKDSLVGVEEACSGVRSLQSTLMAAYCLGEMFRFSWPLRAVFVGLGIAIAFLFNMGRTLFLTLSVYYKGDAFMANIHDTVGNVVSILTFCATLVLALGVRRWLSPKEKSATPPAQGLPDPGGLLAPAAIALGLLLLSYPLSHLWFLRAERGHALTPTLNMAWTRLPVEIREREIPAPTRAILRYSQGSHVHWRTPGQLWTGYFFIWEAGKISSFAGIHRPDICLPSAGLHQIGSPTPLEWQRGDFRLPLLAYRFTKGDPALHPVTYHVFFAVWDDDPQRQVPLATTPGQRVQNALHARRITSRRSLQLIVTGADSLDSAWAQARSWLDAGMTLHSSGQP